MHPNLKVHPSIDGLEILELDPQSEGEALPTLVYCALSAKSSLTLDPFDQPVRPLLGEKIRLLSITLPFHQEGADPKEAMLKWAECIHDDPGFFDRFILSAKNALFSLIASGLIDAKKIALAGLSRGGYTVLRLAATAKEFNRVAAFAPLTSLDSLPEFKATLPQNVIDAFSLKTTIPALIGKHVLIHIGNRDMRVGTGLAFSFAEELVERSFEAGYRSPPVEMLITKSIGHKGHGTPEESFHKGALWIKKELLQNEENL